MVGVLLMSSSIVVELFVGSLVFCAHAGSARWGRLWALVPSVVACGLCFLLSFRVLGALPVSHVVPATLYYVLAYVVATASVAYVRDLHPVEGLVVGSLGYCAQHLWSDVGNVVLGPASQAALPPQGYYLAHIGILAAGYVLVYLAVGRRFRIDEAVVSRRVWWVVASVLALFFVIVFTMVFADGQSGAARDVCYVYDALCTALIMVALIMASRVDGLRARMAQQEALWEQGRSQYELVRQSMELVNRRCHDIRHNVLGLLSHDGGGGASAEQLAQVAREVNVYDSAFRTGNDALDVVLTQKGLACSEQGIELDCLADGAALAHVTDGDIYLLVGGILDVAIADVLASGERARLSIGMSIRARGGFASLREDHYGAHKADRDATHTLANVRHIVESYGGQMQARERDGVRTLTILLPMSSR